MADGHVKTFIFKYDFGCYHYFKERTNMHYTKRKSIMNKKKSLKMFSLLPFKIDFNKMLIYFQFLYIVNNEILNYYILE